MSIHFKNIRGEEEAPATPENPMEKMMSGWMFDKKFIEQRKVFLWGPVDDKSAKEITDRLLYLEAIDPGKDITFYINSPGGLVTAGMVIYDTMQMISSPVSTVCMGMAASMGSILLSGGAKGKRFIFPHGEVSGKSVEQVLKDFDRDYWMDAKEAVEYGIVDGILDKL